MSAPMGMPKLFASVTITSINTDSTSSVGVDLHEVFIVADGLRKRDQGDEP
jgi:hypothetical protein